MRQNNKGGVLAYILIAVALLAAIAYTVAREGGGQQANRLDDKKSVLFATDLMSHVTSVEQAFFQLQQFGTNVDDLRFDKPGDVGFTANISDQIYHPSGGGVQPFETNDASIFDGVGTTGFVFQSNANVEWTPSIATDLILSFINLDTNVCAEINKKMTGSSAIPATTGTTAEVFVEGGTDSPLLAAECPGCQNMLGMCINDGTTNIYYSVVGKR